MNIKNITLFGLFSGLLLFVSCNDDYMERYPENAVSDGAVWKTPADLELYVNNFYNRTDLLPRETDYNAGMYSYDQHNGSDTQIGIDPNTRMNGQSTVPSDGGGWASGDWDELRDINYFFANYKKATGDEAVINKYVGEALFFRAIFYFGKLRSFGDVPWYDHLLSPDDEDLYKDRDPRNVVVDNLMADLDRAVSYLPSHSAGWTGRVNKETAMLLQARIALYEGTWEKYHAGTPFGVAGSDGSKFITKAKDVTEILIASRACDLDNKGQENGYQNVFNQESYKTSREVIFWRQYNKGDGNGNAWADYTTYGGEKSGLTKRIIDMYLCTDGKPIQGNPLYKGDDNLLNEVADRDPRLNQTIYVNDGKHIQFYPDIPFLYPSFTTNDRASVTGYQLYKGHLPNLTTSGLNSGQQALIYFRYAEALLINAEAKAESGTVTQADIDKTINQLRRRLVGMADMKLDEVNALPASDKMFPNLSNIINEIRRERAVELAAEGFRVDDIFRWAAADILINGYVPKGAKRAQWVGDLPDVPNNFATAVNALPVDDDGYINPWAGKPAFSLTEGYKFNLQRDYLKPLPNEQLNLNTKFKQNPGWN